MAIKRVKVKDKQNNTYYPRTIADIVEETDNKNFISLNEKKTISSISNPNLLINGDFQIWQRGTEFNRLRWTYTADRWRIRDTTTVKKENNSIVLETEVRGGGIMQALEFSDFYKGRVLTFSINMKTNSTNNPFKVYVWDGNKTILCASSNTEFKTLTNTLRVSENATLLHFCIETETDNNTVLTINWAKLEWGEVATPFIPRQYTEELVSCQRYCQAYSGIDIHLRTIYPTSGAGFNFLIPIEMRICPSIQWVGTANVDYRIYDILCSNPQIDFSGFTLTSHSNNKNIDIWTIKSNHGLTNMVLRIETTGNLILDAEIY